MDARLEKQASIRSVLFIYRCLPTHLPTYLSTYLPAPVTGRSIPRTGAYVRLATQSNRIESDLSFLPSFFSRPGVAVLVPFLGVRTGRRFDARSRERPSRIHRDDSTRVHPIASDFRIEASRTRRKLETKRTSWRACARPGPRPIDRSIDRSDELDESTKRARAGQTYGAVFCFGKVSCVPDRTKEAFVPRRTAVLGNYQRSYSSTWFRESLVRDSRSRFPSR